MQLEVKVALVSGAASGVETERAGYDAPLNAGGHTSNTQSLSYKGRL